MGVGRFMLLCALLVGFVVGGQGQHGPTPEDTQDWNSRVMTADYPSQTGKIGDELASLKQTLQTLQAEMKRTAMDAGMTDAFKTAIQTIRANGEALQAGFSADSIKAAAKSRSTGRWMYKWTSAEHCLENQRSYCLEEKEKGRSWTVFALDKSGSKGQRVGTAEPIEGEKWERRVKLDEKLGGHTCEILSDARC
ncbi:unnamed protein product [Vitrella brassicaformis CCMP3155]|uniref:Fibrinogen C-terminal domain-containing protein n=1 Tax=Vitrella brassicaformis (strain CCMP3155) TaxID=1169540 RepID=A0A0G4FSX1_VITBC|nr:unnamed protein product [Vitrella brassicaformis CCMP3155]|mmetsp:Transcript_11340/g.27434  ORF Transcript_11340/g.27434 Transcript_11340/m.27434 type:complete len:194 (-) Transcript_11340:320-901(-)|eukprot:CEM17425.1 unnamed protein product [Vitrella brassicaformis CCMP3155]